MTAWFRDNQIYRNDVNGNAQTIYYMQDGEPPQITGMGVIESGDCSFYIEDKQVGDDRLPQGPRLEHLSDGQDSRRSGALPQGVQVGGRAASDAGGGFRPQGPALAARGEEASGASGFPLLKALEERKKQLIEERRWADRNDQVDAATVEWMRALGFEVGQPRESGPKL